MELCWSCGRMQWVCDIKRIFKELGVGVLQGAITGSIIGSIAAILHNLLNTY